jgi:alkylation response protein AidB-like acyl-CoA dehydrogenase
MMQIVLPWFQIGSAAVSIGIAEASFAATVAHTSTASFEHLKETLAASVPGIRSRLARMRLAIDSARAYLDHTLARIEKGSADAMLFVLGSKATAAEMALTVTDEAMRACGGAAFSRDISIERNFRDARAPPSWRRQRMSLRLYRQGCCRPSALLTREVDDVECHHSWRGCI